MDKHDESKLPKWAQRELAWVRSQRDNIVFEAVGGYATLPPHLKVEIDLTGHGPINLSNGDSLGFNRVALERAMVTVLNKGAAKAGSPGRLVPK